MNEENEALAKVIEIVIGIMEDYLIDVHDYKKRDVSKFKLFMAMNLMEKLEEIENENDEDNKEELKND